MGGVGFLVLMGMTQVGLEKVDRSQILKASINTEITEGFNSLSSLLEFLSYTQQSKWGKTTEPSLCTSPRGTRGRCEAGVDSTWDVRVP